MTISNNGNELEQTLVERVKTLYRQQHGQDPTESELLEFIQNTIAPLLAKIEEIRRG